MFRLIDEFYFIIPHLERLLPNIFTLMIIIIKIINVRPQGNIQIVINALTSEIHMKVAVQPCHFLLKNFFTFPSEILQTNNQSFNCFVHSRENLEKQTQIQFSNQPSKL